MDARPDGRAGAEARAEPEPLSATARRVVAETSTLIRTEAELVALGAYRVAPNRWKKGAAEWAPLYEGKMVQAFDHR
ncbi:MAG: hypothetical protein ACK4MT_00930, partial [Thermaurantiacus tibetensis]